MSLKNVLVVDDHVDSVEAICEALAMAGYEVADRRNGKDALTYLENTRDKLPDLILLDMMMPVMDGRGFLEQRRARPWLAKVPVVLLSGERDSPRLAEELGATGSLRKPAGLEQLLAAVARHCAPPPHA